MHQAHQDNEVLPTSAVDQDALNKLGLPSYWKRTMTNDFAVTVHRIKALGACGCAAGRQRSRHQAAMMSAAAGATRLSPVPALLARLPLLKPA